MKRMVLPELHGTQDTETEPNTAKSVRKSRSDGRHCCSTSLSISPLLAEGEGECHPQSTKFYRMRPPTPYSLLCPASGSMTHFRGLRQIQPYALLQSLISLRDDIHFIRLNLSTTVPCSSTASAPDGDCMDSDFAPCGQADSELVAVHCHFLLTCLLPRGQPNGFPFYPQNIHFVAAHHPRHVESWICALVQFCFCQYFQYDFDSSDCRVAGS
jgi:hypothetical protein